MALARLISRGQSGLEAYEVSVEVNIAGGLPGFTITGLPAPAVRESRDRVRAALQNCGQDFPASRVTVHLGPADIPKDGGRFDLAIALGIVAAAGKKKWQLSGTEFVGELALGGELRGVTGIVPAALASRAAGRRLILPAANQAEAALVPGVNAVAAAHLGQVLDELDGTARLQPITAASAPPVAQNPPANLDEVKGHAGAKRALAVAAAGGHNLLLIGPPGSGKSMLASRLPGLLAPLSDDEVLEVASVASVAGARAIGQSRQRPFRSPHHTTRAAALVGGGVHPKPGEISLAHHGVLFLDELPEFARTALEALREPLETGRVAISRIGHRVEFPARFQLIAAMNPCPCGYLGDGSDRCHCGPARVRQYRDRISGPLLDRFDLHLEVNPVGYDQLSSQARTGASAELLATVRQARQRQLARGSLNSALGERQVWECVQPGRPAGRLLAAAQDRWQLSARSIVRILKTARTLADLAGNEQPGEAEIAEALQLRRLDRPYRGDGL